MCCFLNMITYSARKMLQMTHKILFWEEIVLFVAIISYEDDILRISPQSHISITINASEMS